MRPTVPLAILATLALAQPSRADRPREAAVPTDGPPPITFDGRALTDDFVASFAVGELVHWGVCDGEQRVAGVCVFYFADQLSDGTLNTYFMRETTCAASDGDFCRAGYVATSRSESTYSTARLGEKIQVTHRMWTADSLARNSPVQEKYLGHLLIDLRMDSFTLTAYDAKGEVTGSAESLMMGRGQMLVRFEGVEQEVFEAHNAGTGDSLLPRSVVIARDGTTRRLPPPSAGLSRLSADPAATSITLLSARGRASERDGGGQRQRRRDGREASSSRSTETSTATPYVDVCTWSWEAGLIVASSATTQALAYSGTVGAWVLGSAEVLIPELMALSVGTPAGPAMFVAGAAALEAAPALAPALVGAAVVVGVAAGVTGGIALGVNYWCSEPAEEPDEDEGTAVVSSEPDGSEEDGYPTAPTAPSEPIAPGQCGPGFVYTYACWDCSYSYWTGPKDQPLEVEAPGEYTIVNQECCEWGCFDPLEFTW